MAGDTQTSPPSNLERLAMDSRALSIAFRFNDSVPAASVKIAAPLTHVVPQTWTDHLRATAIAGDPHDGVAHTFRTLRLKVLDIPMPFDIDVTPHRCRKCPTNQWHHVTDNDLRREFPDLLKMRDKKQGDVLFTPAFLLYFVMNFYESLNALSTRRAVVEYYATNSLALLRGSFGMAAMACVPSPGALRKLALTAMTNFFETVVSFLQDHIAVYSGTIIRGDGNWDIAQRIRRHVPGQRYDEAPFSVLLAWLTVDGTLYSPPRTYPGEDIDYIEDDLTELVDRIKTKRLSAGLSMAESCPVVHATDSYGKHRLRLARFYQRKYPELATHSQSDTPRGDATGCVLRGIASPCLIAGDPAHDTIAFRRCVPVFGNDACNINADHADVQARLSAELPDTCGDLPVPLAPVGFPLLRVAIRQPLPVLQAKRTDSPEADAAVREFLRQPNLARASTWHRLFRSVPPRGVFARLARHFGITLHVSVSFRNYPSQRAYTEEIDRMEKWYRPGVRQLRRRTGIRRSRRLSLHCNGVKTCWTRKVAAHYTRLGKPLRLEGLWAWRRAALGLHEAGIPMQSGTVSVERFWALLKEMLPRGSRRMSEPWFRLLSMITFVRYTCTHFAGGKLQLPTWCHRDSLLAQRVIGFAQCARAMESTDSEHLRALFDPFRL